MVRFSSVGMPICLLTVYLGVVSSHADSIVELKKSIVQFISDALCVLLSAVSLFLHSLTMPTQMKLLATLISLLPA